MSTRRLRDQHGHLWPITGLRCPVCRMPADSSLDGGPHPSCTPTATAVGQAVHQAAVTTVENLLGAEQIGYFTDRWLVSGQPLDQPTPDNQRTP